MKNHKLECKINNTLFSNEEESGLAGDIIAEIEDLESELEDALSEIKDLRSEIDDLLDTIDSLNNSDE